MTEESERDPLDDVFSFIKQQRDELKLKMHLAQADAKDEWAKLETQWKEVEKRTEPLAGAVKEGAEAVGDQAKNVAEAASELAARELKDGYERLRKILD